MSCSRGGRPADPMDSGGVGGRGTDGGPRSTESSEENEGKFWSGRRNKQTTSLSGSNILRRQETLSLVLGSLDTDRAG